MNSFVDALKTMSQENFAAIWPNLARIGFDVATVRGIVLRREGAGLPCAHFREGLDHADAAVERGLADLKLVSDTLLNHGFFGRPPGYLSVEERADRDAKLTAAADARARSQLEQVHFRMWKLGLSDQEIEEIKAANASVDTPFLDGVLLREWQRRGKPVVDGEKQLEKAQREHCQIWLSLLDPEEVKIVWRLRGWDLPDQDSEE